MKRLAVPAAAACFLLVAAACHDDKPPASMPQVTLHPPVEKVPNDEFDYFYKVKYSWPTTNNKKYHLTNELTCVLNYTKAGSPFLYRARLHAFEFWALDENGQMKDRNFDGMRRDPKPFNEAMECCDFTLNGVKVDQENVPDSATLWQAGSGTFVESEEVSIDTSVNPPRVSPVPAGQRYYDDFTTSPPDRNLVRNMSTILNKSVGWSSRYGFRRPITGPRKDVLVLAGVLGNQSPYGDPAIPHEDCVWP